MGIPAVAQWVKNLTAPAQLTSLTYRCIIPSNEYQLSRDLVYAFFLPHSLFHNTSKIIL